MTYKADDKIYTEIEKIDDKSYKEKIYKDFSMIKWMYLIRQDKLEKAMDEADLQLCEGEYKKEYYKDTRWRICVYDNKENGEFSNGKLSNYFVVDDSIVNRIPEKYLERHNTVNLRELYSKLIKIQNNIHTNLDLAKTQIYNLKKEIESVEGFKFRTK